MGVRILSDAEKVCTRCGIEQGDPRAKQACAAVDSASPYHNFELEKAEAVSLACSSCGGRPTVREMGGEPNRGELCPRCGSGRLA